MREILDRYEPLLKQKIDKFDFVSPPTDPVELAHTLTVLMLKTNGVSLSAPQAGFLYKMFVIKSSPILCCYNPILLDQSEEHIYMEEVCLSFPGTVLKIKRPEVIKVRYTQPNGETVTKKFGGMTARLFLHEMDHLNGILFTQRATKYHLDRGLKHKKIAI